MSDGEESESLQPFTQLIAKSDLRPSYYKSKNHLITFQPEDREMFKNSQLQTNLLV